MSAIFETIRIPMPAEIKDILYKDAENFELFTRSGKINKNELYTRIIVNYSDEFVKNLEAIKMKTKKILDGNDLSDYELTRICEFIQFSSLPISTKKQDGSIAIKPNKQTIDILTQMATDNSFGSGRTVFLRNMFAFYAMQPAEKRERIIFKNICDTLEKAIQKKNNVILLLKSPIGEITKQVRTSPYKIASSKEELHLYLLSQGTDGDTTYTTRMSRICSVSILKNECSAIKEQNIGVFEKMIQHGPQFRFAKEEGEKIIELDEKGKELFHSIYIHRPEVDRIEDNKYYFSCSQEQLFRYFTRFNEGFYVIEPESLRNRIIEFHQRAIEKTLKPFGV